MARYGSRGSFCIDLKKGTFYDNEATKGGGVLDLIERETGKTGADRMIWLSDNKFIDPLPSGDGRKPNVVKTYDYHDENGVLLFQVCRLDPKDFRQRQPTPGNKWDWSVKGVRQVPYRLPELVSEIELGKWVFIVEGEKDADRLRGLGIPATTNAGGAGKWRAELTKIFVGADVVIIPDNDPQTVHPKTGELMFHPDGRLKLPGKDHAEAVAAALSAVAAKVRVLDLKKVWPDMPLKGDVSNWLDNGGTVDAFYALVDSVLAWAPAARPEPVREDSGPREFAPLADEAPIGQPIGEGVERSDFQAFMPGHAYIFVPSGELWPASSVNSRIPTIADGVDKDGKPKFLSASALLDRNRPVEQMTWAPGLPKVIRDRLISDGGWIDRKGVACFNLYREPTIGRGDASKAGPWIKHVRRVYSDDADHLINFFAHRVQRPHEKINHAIVLGGKPGIGKDTILEPVKRAVGPWNCQEVSPKTIFGRFNGFVKSVILRVSEARDLGDVDRYQFYEAMKVYCAAPPDVLRVDEKNLREYGVLNCCGVIITTNHKSDGIYLPPDDRRTYVAWSDLSLEDFHEGYWSRLWGWYEDGGDRHVAEYLRTLDISGFNPKAPPRKTPAFWEIVDANRAPEDAELSDALDRLRNPAAVTLDRIVSAADAELGTWLKDRKSRRMVPHRLEACGYVPVRKDGVKDGQWVIGVNAVARRSMLNPTCQCGTASLQQMSWRGKPKEREKSMTNASMIFWSNPARAVLPKVRKQLQPSASWTCPGVRPSGGCGGREAH